MGKFLYNRSYFLELLTAAFQQAGNLYIFRYLCMDDAFSREIKRDILWNRFA